MRVLFTSIPGYGHFHPLVPVAQALQRAGHEVAFAVAASFGPVVERNGFRHFTAGSDPATMRKEMSAPEWMEQMVQRMRAAAVPLDKHVADTFVGQFAPVMAKDLQRIAAEWRPDLLVRDLMEFGACVAGELLGIPCASIQVGALKPQQLRSEAMLQRLGELRASLGLVPEPHGEMLFRSLHLCLAPPSYLGDAPLTPTTHYLEPALFDQSGDERLPEWVSRLEAGRPVVYATLGTIANKLHAPLRTILAGLRDEPVELVMTVGRDQDPALFGPQPPHVHVERYIPQSLLLPRCDLVVAHGGYNSAMSALSHGLPMVLIPLMADQPLNARRCLDLGVARVLDPQTLTAEQVRDAVREVLSTPSYRDAARRLQAEFTRLPRIEHAVSLLERLAATRAPLLSEPEGS